MCPHYAERRRSLGQPQFEFDLTGREIRVMNYDGSGPVVTAQVHALTKNATRLRALRESGIYRHLRGPIECPMKPLGAFLIKGGS